MQDNTGSKLTTRKENFLKEDTYELEMLINKESLLTFVNALEFSRFLGKIRQKKKKKPDTRYSLDS